MKLVCFEWERGVFLNVNMGKLILFFYTEILMCEHFNEWKNDVQSTLIWNHNFITQFVYMDVNEKTRALSRVFQHCKEKTSFFTSSHICMLYQFSNLDHST